MSYTEEIIIKITIYIIRVISEVISLYVNYFIQIFFLKIRIFFL